MEKAQENFSGHVEIDCRWSTPVRGNHGTVSAVDLETNMVIESTTLTKKGNNRPTGEYCGSSNNMETNGTISVLQKMKDHKIFDHIETISKDREKNLVVYAKLWNKVPHPPNTGTLKNDTLTIVYC